MARSLTLLGRNWFLSFCKRCHWQGAAEDRGVHTRSAHTGLLRYYPPVNLLWPTRERFRDF